LGAIELPSVSRLIHRIVFTIILMNIDLLVEFAQHHVVLLVVELSNVKSLTTIFFSSRKNLDQTFSFFGCYINFVAVHEGHEVVHEHYILVIWV